MWIGTEAAPNLKWQAESTEQFPWYPLRFQVIVSSSLGPMNCVGSINLLFLKHSVKNMTT